MYCIRDAVCTIVEWVEQFLLESNTLSTIRCISILRTCPINHLTRRVAAGEESYHAFPPSTSRSPFLADALNSLAEVSVHWL